MAFEEFDNEVNGSLHQNTYQPQASILGNIFGGAAATIADVGASFWNSLPGTPEVDTEDLLGRIGGDALRIYQEHPDAVHTASLIGGAFLPAGMAVKGLNALRNGSKTVNWFTKAGKEADLSAAKTLFENGKAATTEYRNLKRSIFAKSAINQAVDAVAGEAAILAMMNAHPMMEDYLEDPVKNFAIGAAFGSAIGGTVGIIADNFQLKQVVGAVEEAAIRTVSEEIRPVFSTMPDATALQTFDISIKNLDNLMGARKAAGKTAEDDITYAYAQEVQSKLRGDQERIFDRMISQNIRDLPVEQRDLIKRAVIDDPSFWGVEKIEFAPIPKELATGEAGLLGEIPKLIGKTKKGAEVEVKAAYFSELGQFGTPKDIKHYAGVASLGLSESALIKTLPKRAGEVPNFDSLLETASKSTAHVEAEYAAWTLKLDKMDDAEFGKFLEKATLASEDLPLIQAIVTRLERSPELQISAKVKFADNTPLNEAILAEKKIARTAGGTPVKYQEAVEKILNPNTIDNFDVRKTSSAGTEITIDGKKSTLGELIDSWVSGDGWKMQKAAVAFFTKGTFAKGGIREDIHAADNALAMRDLYHSDESEALRDAFRKIADADGNVYLYRGFSTEKVSGVNPIESMAVTPAKAGEFTKSGGTTKLYKVNVDDIVAAIRDVGPVSNNPTEILVKASAREAEATLSPSGKIAFREQLERSLAPAAASRTADYLELRNTLFQDKHDLITSLIQQGVPIDVIAKKANMELEAVIQFSISGQTLDDLISLAGVIRFSDAEKVRAANAATNRPLLLSGNTKKVDYTRRHASLNDRTMMNINNEATESFLRGSNSTAASEMAELLFVETKNALDIARSQLAKGNNSFAGNRFWNSFDFFARNMGEIGSVFSYVGKGVQGIANRLTTKVVQPISQAMEGVAKDPIALAEFNNFKNINDSLKGYRIFRDGQLFQRAERINEKGKPVIVEEPVLYQGAPLSIKTPSVQKLIEEIQLESKELYNLANAGRRIKGQPNINDIGLWIPSFNPVNKFIAYVHNAAEDTTQLLWGKTSAELEDAIKTFTSQIKQDPNIRIIRKGVQQDQAMWNTLNSRLDTVHMTRADISLQKTGSGASAIPKLTTEVLAEIAGGYEHYINSQVRNLADLSMSDITDMLQKMSAINQRNFAGQPLSAVQKVVAAPKDAALSLRNTLLGGSALGEYDGWKSVNRSFETGVKMATDSLQSIWNSTVSPLAKRTLGGKKTIEASALKDLDYETFVKQMEERGIPNPFAVFDEATAREKYNVARLEDAPDISKRIVYASNALAATSLLRFGDLAQPLVNIMSMPIMTSLAVTSKMPDTFLGVQKATANVSGVQIMHEGIRMTNSPLFELRNKKWEELGYFSPEVSEVTNIQRASRKFEKGPTAAIESITSGDIENKIGKAFFNMMVKPADYAETLTRKVAMNTGAALAKRLYPELDENGITIFARDFMDKAIGNFHAAQRPVFFQGTLGVAMGLFQTYMVTMAQNVYRHLELRDYKNLLKASLLQSTIFGAKSMPGYDQISQTIGEYYSDENFDLTTGTYRATGDTLGDFILYGLPSNLGPAFYTRGDVDPRLPNLLAGAENMVAVNFVSQVTQAMGTVAGALAQNNGQWGQALAQAISLQNMSRPLARTAELATGFSITREGNTVQIPEEVWTPTGIISRVLAMRPFEEAKLRETMHLNTFYGSVDREARQSVVNKLRTGLRNGTLTEAEMAEYAEDYFRKGGSPSGWRNAVNTAIGKTETSGKEVLAEKLAKEDSPLTFMINNLD